MDWNQAPTTHSPSLVYVLTADRYVSQRWQRKKEARGFCWSLTTLFLSFLTAPGCLKSSIMAVSKLFLLFFVELISYFELCTI